MNRFLTILVLATLLAVPNTAISQVLTFEEVVGAPVGYKAYDFFVQTTTDLGVMDMVVSSSGGQIYQNYSTAGDLYDDPLEIYASYVTANFGGTGPNAAQTVISGYADYFGTGPLSFDTSTIDIGWSDGAVMAGAGLIGFPSR